MSDIRAVRTADGRTLTPVQVAAHEGVQRRIMWPSMHWGVEGVHADAWPHIAMAAADAILAEFDVTPRRFRCCDPATITNRIDGTWLVDMHQHHTCGTGPDGHYGAHEPGCGEVPVLNLRGLPGWEQITPSLPSVEDAARAILMVTQAPNVDPDYAWSVQCPEVQDELLDQARAVLALLPGRTEAEVKAEALREAADALDRDDMTADRWYAAWLRDHAERIERDGT